MTTFSLIAKQDYLEKVARTRDPIRAVSEFVWNEPITKRGQPGA